LSPATAANGKQQGALNFLLKMFALFILPERGAFLGPLVKTILLNQNHREIRR